MKFDVDAIPGDLITFHASDGIELQGFLVKSKRRTGKIIVSIHGLTGSFFRSATQKRMIPHYADGGYDYFSINTRGHGTLSPMYRVRGKKVKWMEIGTALERFEDCVKDLKGVVSLLKAKGYRKIILQGHSTGCQKATYYMYKTGDRRISAVVLLAPADDYNTGKKQLKGKWKKAVSIAKKMVKAKSRELMPSRAIIGKRLTAWRFLSTNDLSNVEARLFNYEAKTLKEFRSMTLPVMAVFGSKEQYRTKNVRIYLKMLEKQTRSKNFLAVEIPGANHDFRMHEAETAQAVVEWLDKAV
jgi:alpha-beta hydrolase superfamily lysophospholipase